MLQCVNLASCPQQSVVYIRINDNAVSQRVCDKKRGSECHLFYLVIVDTQLSATKLCYRRHVVCKTTLNIFNSPTFRYTTNRICYIHCCSRFFKYSSRRNPSQPVLECCWNSSTIIYCTFSSH